LDSFARHPHFKKGQSVEPLLFNVVMDIGSKRNVASEHPWIVKRLSDLAEKARKDLGDAGRPAKNQRPPGKTANPLPRRIDQVGH
jgi:hypothetical protein